MYNLVLTLNQCSDITLAREKLVWEPKTTLEEGLKKTIDYFRDLIEKETRI